MINQILSKHQTLKTHSLYERLNTIDNIRIFMQYHVFAVWDFMSLLKSLQKKITCVDIPWVNSNFEPELVQLINEIVLGEESDCDQDGNPISHFSLYIRAMEEIGADTTPIFNFINKKDTSLLHAPIKEAVEFHLNLAQNAQVHEVASSFFYGREKLIPDMFTSLVEVLERNKMNCPSLVYYFKRHIEVDGDNHGPKALTCLNKLTNTKDKEDQALKVALSSLEMRNQIWNFIESQLD